MADAPALVETEKDKRQPTAGPSPGHDHGPAPLFEKEQLPGETMTQAGAIATADPSRLSPNMVLALQGTAGNQAVSAVITQGARPPAPLAHQPGQPEAGLAAAVSAIPGLEVAPGEAPAEEAAEPAADGAPVQAAAPAGGAPAPPASPSTPPGLPRASASSPTGGLLVDAIGTHHDQGQALLENSVDAGIGAVHAAVESGYAQLDAAAAAEVAAIKAGIKAARTRFHALVAGEQAHLRQVEKADAARLAASQRRTELAIAERYELQDHRITAMALLHSQKSVKVGDDAAISARDQIEGMARRARAIGDEKAAAATGKTDEIRQEQAKSARDLAQKTSDTIRKGLVDLMSALRNAGTQTGQSFTQQGEQIVGHVRGGMTPALEQLTGLQQRTGDNLQHSVKTGLAALVNAEKQLTGSLTSLEQRLVREITVQVGAKKAELRLAGDRAVGSLRSQATGAQMAASSALASLAAIAGTARLAPGPAQSLLGMLAAQITAAFAGVTGEAHSATGQLTAAIAEATGQAVAAIKAAGAHAQAQVGELVETTTPKLVKEGRQLAGQLVQLATSSIAVGDDLLGQTSKGLDGQLQQLEASFGDGVGQFKGQLDHEVTGAVAKGQEPLSKLPSHIDESQKKIEDYLSKSWLGRQWADFKELVTNPEFIAAFLVGLAVVVIGVLTLGTGLVALAAIGAVAGALAAGAATITHNVRAGDSWHKDLGRNMAIGAVVGLVAGLATAGLAAGGAALLGPYMAAATAKVVGLIVAVQIVTFVMTVINNLASGQRWDKALLANLAIAAVTERLMSRFLPAPAAKSSRGLEVETEPTSAREPLEPNGRVLPGGKAGPSGLELDLTPPRVMEPVEVEPSLRQIPGAAEGPSGLELDLGPQPKTEPVEALEPSPRELPTKEVGGTEAGGKPAEPGKTEAVDVDELVHEFPDETVMQAPGAEARDPAVARLMYRNLMAQSPGREAGIYRNTVSGEYIVVQGSEGMVSVGGGKAPAGRGWAQAWKGILDVNSDVGEWELQAHSHPVDVGTGVTDPANHLPSGAEGDFGVMRYESTSAGDQPRSSTIDITTERGPDQTRFGYDPRAEKPYWVDYPDAKGSRIRLDFKTIEDYHNWFKNTFGIDLGNIPPEMATAPAEETPVPQNARMTKWGWRGSPSWRQAVAEVAKSGTHETVVGKLPTQAEAEALIEDAGGQVDRIEGPHEPPNPHQYDHINYTTSSGDKGTVKIESIQNPR